MKNNERSTVEVQIIRSGRRGERPVHGYNIVKDGRVVAFQMVGSAHQAMMAAAEVVNQYR